ncbi:MAG: hypothetical protein ACRCRV_04785 [Cetobacterium sp.]
MSQTKERVVFYEEPRIMDEVDKAIEQIKEEENEEITRSSFIRKAIRKYLKLFNSTK